MSDESNKFRKNERVQKKKDFNNIFGNGKIIRGRYYFCRYLPNNLSSNRIGIIVRKKIGNSTERNYEKRIIREFFRTKKHRLKNSYDLVFSLLQQSGSYLEKKEEFEKLLSKIEQHAN